MWVQKWGDAEPRLGSAELIDFNNRSRDKLTACAQTMSGSATWMTAPLSKIIRDAQEIEQ